MVQHRIGVKYMMGQRWNKSWRRVLCGLCAGLVLLSASVAGAANKGAAAKAAAKAAIEAKAKEKEKVKEKEKAKEEGQKVEVTAKSAVLIEGSTGEILYELDKDKQLMPASITKIMTLLLIFEALETGKIHLEDEVSVSEHAASMGGSQVYLEPSEKQSVDTMIKCISIASANDASVAMAEYVGGSESEFVARMNEKAKELGMENTHFLNCCGLDDDIVQGHYSSAYDIALMSRELVSKYPQISNYSTVWMDSFTHTTKKGSSEFGLTNTNKLVRTYDGITGLKTGSTSKAKYCLSATAKRNGMDLIAVVMASESPKERFVDAAKLLDYGFANCRMYTDENEELLSVRLPIARGKQEDFGIMAEGDFSQVLMQGENEEDMEKKVIYQENLQAPIKKGDKVGEIRYYLKGSQMGTVAVIATEDVEKADYGDYLKKTFQRFFMKKEEKALS